MEDINLQISLEEAHGYASGFLSGGQVATYIPELSKADPAMLGACMITADGAMHCVGDWESPFTMQSISKVVSLLLALETAGYGGVFDKVGMEPTGDPFNSIVRLETSAPTPSNPLINAGAIVVASCIVCDNALERGLDLTRRLCGNPTIRCNEAVYRSEKNAGMRNRAMAYFLKSEGILEGDVEAVLDMYFHMCSIAVNSRDLARFGLVLACDGMDPLTGEQVVESWAVRIAKTLMLTCGLYESSGEYAVKVGVPSKSGVGGGLLASVEKRMGIGICGPALDKKGNSIGAQKAMEYLSHHLNLHLFNRI